MFGGNTSTKRLSLSKQQQQQNITRMGGNKSLRNSVSLSFQAANQTTVAVIEKK